MAAAVAARARGAVIGNLIGDAAAVPVHWVYDSAKLAKHFETAKTKPAFCDPPGNNFYTTPPGALSCYGDQTLMLLQSLVATAGHLDPEDYAERVAARFGKDTPYELKATDPDNWPEFKQNPKDADGKIIEEQRLWSMPVEGPWRHGSIKDFLKHYVVEGKRFPGCGSTKDEQVDGICKVAPLVALLAGDPQLLPTVEQAVRVTQNTDKAVGYACGFARLLEKLVLGSAASVAEAAAATAAELADGGRACPGARDAEVAQQLARLAEELKGLSPEEAALALRPEGGSPFGGKS